MNKQSEFVDWARYLIVVLGVAALGIAIGLWLTPAKADDGLWITSGMWSRHPNEQHYQYNQHNVGIGLAYQRGNYNLVAGEYDNSLRHHSNYLGIINQPYSLGPVRIGYLAGFVSGYTKTPAFAPAVAPVLSYEYRKVGINLIVIPSVVTAIQLKIKVW